MIVLEATTCSTWEGIAADLMYGGRVQQVRSGNLVYRLYDEARRLLWVGVSRSVRARLQTHERVAPWWPRVRTVVLEEYASRAAAEVAEATAIASEGPEFNQAGTSAEPGRASTGGFARVGGPG